MISSAMLAAEDPLRTTSERNQVSDRAERYAVKISVSSKFQRNYRNYLLKIANEINWCALCITDTELL